MRAWKVCYTTWLEGSRLKVIACAMLVLHAGLLAWGAWRHSPTYDEIAYLPAGVSHWQLGRFDLCRVNPPLTRLLAAIPVVLSQPETDWSHYTTDPTARPRFGVGRDFVVANGGKSFWYFTLARWACIPLSVMGGYFFYRWSIELYGAASGILALTLWCVSPNIIAHGQLVTPDAGGVAFGVVAGYAFWRWLKKPSWRLALAGGLALGLVELTRTTWIVLFGLWPTLWLVWNWTSVREMARPAKLRQAAQLSLILLVGLYVLNLGFAFEGSFRRLGEYEFVSDTLTGHAEEDSSNRKTGNRFAGTWLGAIPVPLPKNYVQGIDAQKLDFERKMPSYLRGEWRLGGWWYYYLYALAIKVPLGTWGIVLLATLASVFWKGYSASWRDELVLLAPIVVILTFVSSQTGFNSHMRYVLAVFPFAFIWASKAARAVNLRHRTIAWVGAAALFWSITSSLWIYPHSLSYFNELVGGPARGHVHLCDSNIDWGQDLLYLKRWLDKHPEARPLGFAYFLPHLDPQIVGIKYTLPPTGPKVRPQRSPESNSATGPQPGWYAISVNKIRSYTGEYEYFLQFEPVAMAGYSIFIYHITLDDANRVRRELGLPQLPKDWQETAGTGNHDDAR